MKHLITQMILENIYESESRILSVGSTMCMSFWLMFVSGLIACATLSQSREKADGFFKFWMKFGDDDFQQKIDYKGRTWWNDEDDGPYFKMGAYMGEPGWDGPETRTLYTDEYRLGSEYATFEDVAPGND